MKAVVINKYGSADVLTIANVNKPIPGRGEILVEVRAVALNPVDYKIREGHLQELFAVTFPRILGGDVSGIVKELGQDSTDFKVGDEVFFANPLNEDGGYAEFVKIDQKLVAKKPSNLNFEEMASFPVVGLTSIQALRDFGGLKKGMKVLIHAGAGGVGSFAIQYAKAMGAEVYTTASADKAEYVRSLGADHVIDYQKEDFLDIAKKVGGMDIVFETIGGLNYPKSIQATKRGGAVPCIVNPPDADARALAEKLGVKTDFFLLQGKREDLNTIATLAAQGAVKPKISKILRLDDVREGHRLLESGRTQGKLVVSLQ